MRTDVPEPAIPECPESPASSLPQAAPPHSGSAWRVREVLVHHLLHADDPPHRLALGVAIGVFVTFTPTVGVQMAIVVLLAWLLRANKVVGVPIVWITNPATIVPIYWGCYWLGCKLLRRQLVDGDWLADFAQAQHISTYWHKLLEITLPLWLGCLVVALAASIPSYYATYWLVVHHRRRRHAREATG